VVVHAYNPSAQDTEARRWGVQDQPGLQSKFETNLSYVVKHCLTKEKAEVNVQTSCAWVIKEVCALDFASYRQTDCFHLSSFDQHL
jgi:hypothetical protein